MTDAFQYTPDFSLPLLRLSDAVATLDDNTIVTSDWEQLGDMLRVSIQDAGGSGYADPTDGATLIFRAKDRLGQVVTAPWATATINLHVVVRPEDVDPDVTIEVGICTGADASEFFGMGLYYTDVDGTVHQRHVWSGTAAASSDLAVKQVSRIQFTATGGPSSTDESGARRVARSAAIMYDGGVYYSQYTLTTGNINLTSSDLYFYVSVYPTGALTNEQTVGIIARAEAVPMKVGTYDISPSRAGAQILWQIGDSITSEVDTDRLGSNRNRLLEELNRRAPSRFVSPDGHSSDTYSSWRKHSGVPGATSGTILTNIATYIAGLTSTPDIVTIMLGTNDAAAAVNASTFGTNMQGIIDAIAAEFPSAAIYVAYPTPTSTGANDTVQQTYSAVIDALTGVTGVVDMRTDFNTGTMLDDAVHPNALGHEHIATKWAAAITLAGE